MMDFVFKEYCPLKKETICEAECIEITAELDKLKKEEHLLVLRRILNKTNQEMIKVCESCCNYEMYD